MKGFFNAILVIIMMITSLPTNIKDVNRDDTILSNYNIVYYEDMSSMKGRTLAPTIIVLNENQLTSLRERVADLFRSADMVLGTAYA